MMQKTVVVKLLTVLFLLNSTISYAQKSDITTTVQTSVYERSNPDKAASDYYLRGKEIQVKGDLELALRYFIKAVAIAPNHAPSNYEIAKYTDPKIGLEFSQKAYASDSTNFWYCSQLADIYSSLQMFPLAVSLAESAIELNPMNDEAYRKLSSYYFYSNKVDKAMSLIDTMLTRFGKDPEIALLHCNMIKNLRQPTPKMLASVEEYVTEFSDLPHFVLVAGDISMNIGKEAEAIAYYKRAKEIDPEELRGDVNLFDYYYRRQNQVEAIKYISSLFRADEIDVEDKIKLYRELIETNVYLYRNCFADVDNASITLMLAYPKNMDVRKIYTEHLLRKGDIDSALSFNKTGLESGAYDYDSFETIIQIEAFKKNFEAVDGYITRGIELFPEKISDFNFTRISLYATTKRTEEAIALINKEIKSTKNDSLRSIYYCILGDTYHAENKNKQSYKAYEQSIKYDAGNVVALNNYSYYLSLEEKDLEKALRMSKIVVDKEPSNSTYIDTYAWILYKLERYEEARKVIARAVALDTTKSSSLFLHYGDILYKLGERSLAEDCWRKALELGEKQDIIEQRIKQK